MLYVLTNSDGTLDRYPYTLTELIRSNPATSWPDVPSAALVASFNVYPVKPSDQPPSDHTVNLERTAIKEDDQWVEKWSVVPATPEQIAERTASQAEEIRQRRDEALKQSDWTQLADAALDTSQAQEWRDYRDDLRAVPQQTGFPWQVVWPIAPTS